MREIHQKTLSVDVNEVKEERSTVSLEDSEAVYTDLVKRAAASGYESAIDFSAYLRKPFPHQEEGIRWFLGLAHADIDKDIQQPGSIQGALLADDMGLGKTYMSLVGISEYCRLNQVQRRDGKTGSDRCSAQSDRKLGRRGCQDLCQKPLS